MNRAQVEYGCTILRGYRESPFHELSYLRAEAPFVSDLFSKFRWPPEACRFHESRLYF